jgi:RNA polymerase sigma-70 factor (ECF subfamily)
VALIDLLRRTVQRDEAAFSALYDATSRRVFGLASRILGDHGAAEEATLDAYTSVWLRASDYDAQRSAPMTWILTLTRSRAIDIWRSRARRTNKEQQGLEKVYRAQDPCPSPEGASEHTERCTQLRAALDCLPREQRVAIETAYFAGLSYAEVASALGQPLGTVKSRIRLGLTSLRRQLAEVE